MGARRAEDVAAALAEVERAVEGEGLLAAGYLAYEAGAAYALSTHPPDPDGPPLLWFGLFGRRAPAGPPAADGAYRFGPWQPALDFPTYAAALAGIKAAIARGEAVVRAIQHREGALGRVLEAVTQYEQGHFEHPAVAELAGLDLTALYVEAVEFTQGILAASR